MSLQFIFGYSGSGKTSYILQKVLDDARKNLRKNYYIVVPEQFTMQSQRELVKLQQDHCIMNIDVVSFQRLAYRVFDELGKTDMAVLEETGKNLMLRKVAQDKKDELHVLQANMKKMGYISEVKSLISELTQYNVEPDDLERFLNEASLSTAFSEKLGDVLTMYRGFREALEGTYITSEEVLEVFCHVAAESELLQDAVFVFDGYTGFTPIQNKVIRTLMGLAGQIYVTVTIDEREDPYSYCGMQDLFAMSKKTVQSLMKMAQTEQIEVEEPVVIRNTAKDRFTNAPAIRFLEHNIFRTKQQTMPGKEQSEIQIFSVSDPRMELRYVAGEIARLVKQEQYRYREIAVISGAVETYGNYVPQIFEEYQIPFFLDTTKDILMHPFVEFVRAVLQVLSDNYSYEAMFRYLRCGLSGVTEEETDMLENYVLARGIRGAGKWGQRFALPARDMREEDLERVEEIRRKVMEPFAVLQDVVTKGEVQVRELSVALYRFIVSLQIEQQLKERENRYQQKNDLSRAKEYAQIYRIVMDLLDKLVSLLGDERMPLDEYAKILDAGFETAKVGVIPSGYDRVMIGDIERSRLDDVKILFMVGVNDGIVPKRESKGGIISQFEREEMARYNLELSPTDREKIFIQRFYLYLAMTKPSHRLYLSYVRMGTGGEAMRPSYLIHLIERLFPGMETTYVEDSVIHDAVVTPKSSIAFLIEGLHPEQDWSSQTEEQWKTLVHWYHVHPEYQKRMEGILAAADMRYQEETIGRAVAKALYGDVLTGSVTRLERYAACACAHFLTYGLKLKERELFEFRMVDMGTIYHCALENYAKYLEESESTWFDIKDELREELAERAMGDAIAQAGNTALADTAQNRYQVEKMKQIFQRSIWALTRQIRQGKFTPADYEVSFSFTEGEDASVQEDGAMKLSGRIDRVDTYETEDKLYVKIVDYKSGNAGFDLSGLYYGLKLQLVVYMNAAMKLLGRKNPDKEIVPAGMFYYHLDDPMVDGNGNETSEEVSRKILEKLRMDGVVNTEDEIYREMDNQLSGKSLVIPLSVNKDGSVRANDKVTDKEEFALLSSYTSHIITRSAKELSAGDAAVRPYEQKGKSSCDYCPYAAVCGLDANVPGYQVRKLPEMDTEQIYEKMKEAIDQ